MLSKSELFYKFSNFPLSLTSDTLPIYSNSNLYFEPLSMSGLEEMHRYSTDNRLYEFLEYDPFRDISETSEYLKKLLNRMSGNGDDRTASYWFVRRKDDKYLVGTACLVNLNYQRQSVEWGYGIDPDLWGAGYIFQIQDILKTITFDHLELNRLCGLTSDKNKRTINSVLASGMQKEGIIRDFLKIDGVYHDGFQYGMIYSDYLRNTLSESDSYTLRKKTTGNRINLEQIEITAEPAKITRPKSSAPTVEAYSVISEQDIIDLVARIITEEEVGVDSGMHNLMTWDSLNHMNIMVALHEHLGLKLYPAEISRAISVKSILEIVGSRT